MGLFGKLFEKKVCDLCGGDIGLLGNRKLEDGNMCKTCAGKLSPWFSERRSSTVEQIREQLAYREDNRKAVESFQVTASYGEGTRLLLDENARKFLVTRSKDLQEANPDVVDFAQVTGVDIDIDEHSSEQKRENRKPDGSTERVSYTPPRFLWTYDFSIVIRVNHPYFDDMRFQLNEDDVELNPENPLPAARKPDPARCLEYVKYNDMANELKALLQGARRQVREEAAAAAAPRKAVVCPYCGATTTPDAQGCCEYCGGAVNG